MKRISFFILLIITNITYSQKGVKIGYIDTEYILQNLPEFNQVSSRLEEKAQDWKEEIDKRSREIDKKKNL